MSQCVSLKLQQNQYVRTLHAVCQHKNIYKYSGGGGWTKSTLVNPLDSKGNYSATSNKTKLIGTLAVDGWAVISDTARRGLGGAPPITIAL